MSVASAYHQPQSLHKALELLAAGDAQIIAGATDVYPARVPDRAWARPAASTCWVDISRVPELAGIRQTASGWRLGAGVTWADIQASSLPPAFDALRAASAEVGGLQIQHRATLTGNLCNASPAADGVPALLCLEAEVELQSLSGERRLPLAQFITGNRQTLRAPDELVTAVHIPHSDLTRGGRSAFHKLGARRYLVISIVMAAAVVTTDSMQRVESISLAVGACSPVATRLRGLEQALINQPLDASIIDVVAAEHFADLSPIDDVRASGEYRLQQARNAVCQLLLTLAQSPSPHAMASGRIS